MTARKNFKRGGRPLADAPTADEAGGPSEHRNMEEPSGEGATLDEAPPRNGEGGIEAPGVAPHAQHPRSSPDPKKRTAQAKAAKPKATKHARTGKAKTTTTRH
jgi:hypothetical protein